MHEPALALSIASNLSSWAAISSAVAATIFNFGRELDNL
jgi:hypothetical protein